MSGAFDFQISSGQALDTASIDNNTDWHRLNGVGCMRLREVSPEQVLDAEVVIPKQDGTESR